MLRLEEMASPKPHCNCRVKESCPLNGDCLQSSFVYGCKMTPNDTAQDSSYYIDLTQKTHSKINTTTPLNTKLERIALNFQTRYRTKRRINKRYHLSGT